MIKSAVIVAVSTDTLLAEQRPRAMLPVLGKPMVVRVMDRLYKAGIRHFIVIVGISEGAVAAYLNKQWMPDAQIEFVLKSNETLSLLLTRIAAKLDQEFIAAGYNSFTHEHFTTSLLKQHAEHPESIIIAGARSTLSPSGAKFFVASRSITSEISTEKADKDSLTIGEQAVFGRAGVDFLKNLDEKTASAYGKNLSEIIHRCSAQAGISLHVAETAWLLCVENETDLLILNKRMLDESNDAHILSELPYTVKVIPPVRIDPQVSVGQGVVIGPYVYIERGSSIGYGARLKNTIVLERSSVPADANLNGCIVTTRGTVTV